MFKACDISVAALLAAAAVLCAVGDVARASHSLAGPPLSQEGITTARGVNFMEVIIQDLKRNNDDYNERLLGTRPALVAVKSLPSVRNNKRIKIKSNRRNNDHYYEMYDFLNQPPFVDNKSSSNIATEIQKLRKLSPGLNLFPILNNQSLVVSSQQPFLNFIQSMKQKRQQMILPQTKQNKTLKFKQFMEKNKDFIKQYMNTKTEVPFQKADLRQFPREHTQEQGIPRINMGSKQAASTNDGELPRPDALDMAPARGELVFRHRLKDRLCHRHVLMPEGPKYDSAGRRYVRDRHRAGTHLLGRHRADTRTPLLLLPRCCNCCKKSVLGCQ